MTVHDRLAPGKYRLRVEDYEALAETGAFSDDGYGELQRQEFGGDIIAATIPHLTISTAAL